MKKRNIDELKTKPVVELKTMLREERQKLQSLRFELAAGKVKNIHELRESRKLSARLLTFIKAKSER